MSDLVAAEDDLIGETIDEFANDIADLEREMKEEGGKDPRRVQEIQDRIAELARYIQQFDDLQNIFEDKIKKLGMKFCDLERLMKLLDEQSQAGKTLKSNFNAT